MKVKLLVLYVLGVCGLCCGQDAPITYAEETDSLPKQYFIDRYENVFMTKIPTRQILKLDYTGSKKLFVDGSIYYSKNIISKFPADRKGYFASRLGLGFTF